MNCNFDNTEKTAEELIRELEVLLAKRRAVKELEARR